MAHQTFPCVNCGAQLTFKPGTSALECSACGTSQPVPTSDATIDEHDLDAALAGAEQVDPMSLREGGVEVECQGCGAIAMMEGAADRCAFCDAPVVVLTEHASLIPPESVLPFGIEEKQAGATFKDWLGALWFAPSDLQTRAQQGAIDGVYLPYWTFDSNAAGTYTGERGEDYWETETYTDAEGQEQERKTRETNWTSVQGDVQHDFDDILVCATSSLPRTLTERLEPWDLEALVPFEPSFLAGFTAERYSVDLQPSWETAQERMERTLRDDVKEDIGGDRQKIETLDVHHRGTTFKHTLLPLWISAYRYNGEVYRVIVNARTGAISGDRPYSKPKIAFAVFLLISIVALLCSGLSCCGGGAAVGSS